MSRLAPRVERLEAKHCPPAPPMSVYLLGEHDPVPPVEYRDGTALEQFVIRIIGVKPLHRGDTFVPYPG
jgi:hypothetical protein